MKPEPLTENNRFKCSTGTGTEIYYFSRTENKNVRTGTVSIHFKMFFAIFRTNIVLHYKKIPRIICKTYHSKMHAFVRLYIQIYLVIKLGFPYILQFLKISLL